jgi:hypothetical protein
MKIFASELGQNYESLTFGYSNYATLEEGDHLPAVYQAGFLPYSGVKDTKGIFYFARNARVKLPEWKMHSENRRIAKKFDGQFTKMRTPLKDFKITDEFVSFWLSYFKQRHRPGIMPRERLDLILSFGLVSTVISYHDKDGKPVGYVLEVEAQGMRHYWYSAYEMSLVKQSLGLWLMGDCVKDAHEAGFKHYYLGTVYGFKALYKTNFEPLEWWNGKEWDSDLSLLKQRARSDDERSIPFIDEWRSGQKLF